MTGPFFRSENNGGVQEWRQCWWDAWHNRHKAAAIRDELGARVSRVLGYEPEAVIRRRCMDARAAARDLHDAMTGKEQDQ
jgi:hypothetical protein